MLKKTTNIPLIMGVFVVLGCTPNNMPTPDATKSNVPASNSPISSPNVSVTSTPSSTSQPILVNPTPTAFISPSANTTIPSVTPLIKVSVLSVSTKEGNIGNSVLLKGNNFISGNVKEVIFVNSANSEIKANISNKTENEINFTIPGNTLINIPSNSYEINQGYQYLKLFLVLNNSEKVLVSDLFKIYTTSNTSGSSSGGGGSSSGGGSTTTPASGNGNVTVSVNTSAPTQSTGNVSVNVDTSQPSQSTGNVSVIFDASKPQN